jgi:hypothetical protein
VDGKFVLKVGNYGLPTLYRKTIPHELTYQYYVSLYWTAPEHLNDSNEPGTQEGDVYAYGIMLQEVILREEPYSMYQLEPEGKASAVVRRKKWQIFHQNVPVISLNQHIRDLCRNHRSSSQSRIVLSTQCHHHGRCTWFVVFDGAMLARRSNGTTSLPANQDQFKTNDQVSHPSSQLQLNSKIPFFAQFQFLFSRGAVEKSNIVDLLISRMESYTADLERMVEEKTLAFQEEKKKAEALLNQILPAYVDHFDECG